MAESLHSGPWTGLPASEYGNVSASYKPRRVSCLLGITKESPFPPGHPSPGNPGIQDTRKGMSLGHNPRQTGMQGRVKGRGHLCFCRAHGCCPTGLRAWGPQLWVHVSKSLMGALAGTGQQTSAASLLWPLPLRECEKASVLVETTLYLVPCLNDCGPYGQCLLLRRHGYLYAGCSCKAGEDQA